MAAEKEEQLIMATETKATHTPGPWHYNQEDGYIESEFGIIARACGWTDPDDETLPNARLIAAAPDLLAVLVQAVESCGWSLSGPTDSRAAENGEPAWVCNARAAIARAERGE